MIPAVGLSLFFLVIAVSLISVGVYRLVILVIRRRPPVVTGGRTALASLPASGLVTLRGFNLDHKE